MFNLIVHTHVNTLIAEITRSSSSNCFTPLNHVGVLQFIYIYDKRRKSVSVESARESREIYEQTRRRRLHPSAYFLNELHTRLMIKELVQAA